METMEITGKCYDDEKDEYILTLNAQGMNIHVWIKVGEYNKINEESFIDICKCIFNDSIKRKDPKDINETLFDISDTHVYSRWSLDMEEYILSIDEIRILNQDEFDYIITNNEIDKMINNINLN